MSRSLFLRYNRWWRIVQLSCLFRWIVCYIILYLFHRTGYRAEAWTDL